MLFIHLLIVIYLFVYLFTYSLLAHSFARSFIHSFIYFKVNLIDYMLDFTRFILQGVLALLEKVIIRPVMENMMKIQVVLKMIDLVNPMIRQEMDNYRIILTVMEVLSMIKKTVEQVAIISLMEVVTFRLQNWKVVTMNLTSPWRKNFFTHDALTKVMMFLMKNMCSG